MDKEKEVVTLVKFAQKREGLFRDIMEKSSLSPTVRVNYFRRIIHNYSAPLQS